MNSTVLFPQKGKRDPCAAQLGMDISPVRLGDGAPGAVWDLRKQQPFEIAIGHIVGHRPGHTSSTSTNFAAPAGFMTGCKR